MFDGPITNLLSIVCILIAVLSRAHANGRGEGGGGGNDVRFGTSVGYLALPLIIFRVTERQAWQ